MIYPGVEQGAAGVEVVVRQWGERLLEGYERNALVGWEWGSRSRGTFTYRWQYKGWCKSKEVEKQKRWGRLTGKEWSGRGEAAGLGGFVGVRNAMEVVWDGSWRVSVGQGLTVAIYPHRDSRRRLGGVWGACRGVARSGMGQDDAAEDGAGGRG